MSVKTMAAVVTLGRTAAMVVVLLRGDRRLGATIARVAELLSLTDDLPEINYAPDDVVIAEGTRTGSIWVLVSGSVDIRRGDQHIGVVDQPGASFGEISILLDQPHGASVVARVPTVMRKVVDGVRMLDERPGLARLAATSLARRLDSLTIYLADVQRQYGAAPGIAMVTDVLRHISQQSGPEVRPTSSRDPDPEY
jgi:CRP/FNR family transcriptional regulator, cyclic AMP receptor protein